LVLLALALGVAVMDRRIGQDGTPSTRQEATEPSSREMVRLAEEATAQARALAPDNALYLMAYAGGSGLYTFRFAVPDGSVDTVVSGPNTEPGVPRWEVLREDHPVPGHRPVLDVRSLQKSAVEVVKVAARASGAPEMSSLALVFFGFCVR
jgi:hypothetical protein